MPVQRRRTFLYASLALAAIWILAFAGYFFARNSRMTAEKVQAYAESVDLSKLTGTARARALQELADKLNALSPDERRQARLDRVGMTWFNAMSEQEKSDFLDQTLPTNFKQMIQSFEKMPEEKRRKAIDDSLRRLREAQAQMASGSLPPDGRGGPLISEELQNKVRTIGLSTFLSQSSAQTKAELAPLLEELQRTMEQGGRFRHP